MSSKKTTLPKKRRSMYALRLHQTEAGGGLLLVIPFDQVLDAAVGIQQAAQAAVVVQAGNDVGNILAHVRLDEPRGVLQFVGAVGQVGGDHAADVAFLVGLVEGVQTVGEQGEGGGSENAVGLALLQLVGQIQNAVAGA